MWVVLLTRLKFWFENSWVCVCVYCPNRLNECLLSLKCRTENVYIALMVADFSWTNPLFHLVNFQR
jgi:hypothetical protein